LIFFIRIDLNLFFSLLAFQKIVSLLHQINVNMAKIRNLKRVINSELSSVIEECYVWQLVNQEKAEKAEDVIDEAIAHFDNLIDRVNADNVQNVKNHFKNIKSDLNKATAELLEKLPKL
jgi:flagellar biosynthesis/type III secretory pathway protein FliH